MRVKPLFRILTVMVRSHSDIARMGAEATNKILTKEARAKAARKGWRKRKKSV